ncbi:MAG: hypothetical protein B6I20_12285 [Bacteroidetes bacterium 4572_117]|nr:MAG: hypothetical protein B6I20_12285 [Bacteroidetes bacterium 4572_117]
MSITIFIIILTSLVSIIGFKNQELFNKFKLNPYLIFHKKEYVRVFSHAVLHADWTHLGFNMFTLYFFGRSAEMYLENFFDNGKIIFVLLYVFGIAVSALPSILKHKNNSWYNSIGASGAVSAVLFASIFFDPRMGIYIFLIPIPIPGFVFGIAYLAYTQYMNKKSNDNINHEAHFAGAIFGFFFPLLLKPELFNYFLSNLLNG